jgi:hypothetical protein
VYCKNPDIMMFIKDEIALDRRKEREAQGEGGSGKGRWAGEGLRYSRADDGGGFGLQELGNEADAAAAQRVLFIWGRGEWKW